MTAAELRAVAPRLCRAHDTLVDARYRAARGRRFAINQLHEAERLLAHRELQLVRACETKSARYIRNRQTKLKIAESKVAHWERRLEQATAEVERLGRIAA